MRVLGVTCHLHFGQNDRGLLRSTAVTRGVERTPNKSQHTKLTLKKKILPPAPAGIRTRNLSITSPVFLPTLRCAGFPSSVRMRYCLLRRCCSKVTSLSLCFKSVSQTWRQLFGLFAWILYLTFRLAEAARVIGSPDPSIGQSTKL